MNKPLLDRSQFGPPEHFDDEIRAYRSSSRYVPTALETLLYELAGHKCTICHAPWLEIHHIQELGDGGKTEYENLIVLCPNCHTRVHQDGIPKSEELRHYKTKQEIAYELPILSKLTAAEKKFVNDVASKSTEDQLVFSKRLRREVDAPTHDEAVEMLKREVGLFQLQEFGMVAVDLQSSIGIIHGARTSVDLRIKLTGKGIKWLRYLNATSRIPMPGSL
jgi:5-methylcytosine-specific restriction endonuclease McrA